MANIVHLMVENYNEVFEPRKDPVVESWLFMKTPLPIIAMVIGYLYFVLKLGPDLMAKKEPFQLKKVMVAYNAYQVLFSTWLVSRMLFNRNFLVNIFGMNYCTNPSPYDVYRLELADGAWWYFFSKIVELLDTVFFVLRKKQSQVSFLHVYHHATVLFFSWFYLKYLPGEQGVVIGMLNSMVHIVMYSYYLIAALGPKYQKYLWWKKYMTWIQLVQFGLMVTYMSLMLLMDCKVPKAVTFFFLIHCTIFLFLFTDFYRKAYKKNNKVQNGPFRERHSKTQ